MKVLIVNSSDIKGGAARAAYRLHCGLLAAGVKSQILAQSKTSDDFNVIGPETIVQKAIGQIRSKIDNLLIYPYKHRSKSLFSPNWVPLSSVVDRINDIDPDIVHLHWVNGGMIRIEDIAQIKAPIIWSLHDMWAFTGGCHYDEECGRYKNYCGNCPILGSNKEQDLSARIYFKKKKVYSRIKQLSFIGLSRWLTDCAKESSLLKNRSVFNLPNSICTTSFAPIDKSFARELFNLPQDKKLVLFGAMGATTDPRKGFKELAIALQKIDFGDTELVVFGSCKPHTSQGFKQKTYYLGQLNDDVSLRALYNAADVLVVPSLQENLSNAIMEALACGTPVVGFEIGGNGDLVEHKKTGYLAQPYNNADFARGIEWVLNSPLYPELRHNARTKVLRDFDTKVVSAKYISLYSQILTEGN